MSNDRASFTSRWPLWLVHLTLGWLAVAGLLLQLWPDLPSTWRQLALVVGLGPPLYVFAEGASGWLLSPKNDDAISRQRFPVVRIGIALLVALAWFALAWWLASFIGSPA